LNETEASPYVPDDAWLYFLRLVDWCRKYKIQVWADLHTAPGSQNGFDNSGRLSTVKTCSEWNENATLSALQSILVAMHNDDLQDVVTGIGVLNEPWKDCHNIREYNRKALQLVRQTLGNTTSVIIGDTFNATLWNDGYWENEPHTYLDSHYYHVFAENTRALSPKQHIALVCRKNARDTNECCHEGAASGEKPASGISRLVSEWSAAYDTEPNELLKEVMAGILETGEAPRLHRNLTQGERDFVKQFCKAQMVVYESNATGVSSGWFYWNFKMEGGAFAEWDFLRGVREGWIPTLPAQNVSSVSKFGTCEQILYETVNDKTIIHEYPDPNKVDTWKGDPLDDDLVISMGKTDSEENGGESSSPTKEGKETTGEKAFSGYADDDDDSVPDSPPTDDDGYNTSGKAPAEKKKKKGHGFFTLVVLGFFAYGIKRVFFSEREVPPWRARDGYSSIHGSSTGEAVTMAV
jgi:glucan 1,3-beta-glucosidase